MAMTHPMIHPSGHDTRTGSSGFESAPDSELLQVPGANARASEDTRLQHFCQSGE